MNATLSIAPILRAAFPLHTAKNAARAAGVSVRTVQGWMAERCQPSSAALLRMADHNDMVRRELILRLTLQQGYSNGQMAARARPVVGNALPGAGDAPHGLRAALPGLG